LNFLLDTNVVSALSRPKRDVRTMQWLDRADPATLHISVLTVGELEKGVALARRREAAMGAALGDWLASVHLRFADRVLGVDLAVAQTWGRLAAARPLPVVDALLAATAISHGMVLVTRNVRDIADTGVSYLDPWAA